MASQAEPFASDICHLLSLRAVTAVTHFKKTQTKIVCTRTTGGWADLPLALGQFPAFL